MAGQSWPEWQVVTENGSCEEYSPDGTTLQNTIGVTESAMRKIFVFAALLLAQVSGPAMAQDHNGDPHWLRTFDSGCWIYEPFPEPNENVSWEGRCDANGDATGSGKTTWFILDEWKIVETGEMRGGLQYGWWLRRSFRGEVEESYWEGGARLAVRGEDPAPAYGGSQSPPSGASGPTLGQQAMETLERQRKENCARQAKGANIGGCY